MYNLYIYIYIYIYIYHVYILYIYIYIYNTMKVCDLRFHEVLQATIISQITKYIYIYIDTLQMYGYHYFTWWGCGRPNVV